MHLKRAIKIDHRLASLLCSMIFVKLKLTWLKSREPIRRNRSFILVCRYLDLENSPTINIQPIKSVKIIGKSYGNASVIYFPQTKTTNGLFPLLNCGTRLYILRVFTWRHSKCTLTLNSFVVVSFKTCVTVLYYYLFVSRLD